MLREIDVTGFRAFERLNVRGLGRINLIVGQNNSGKTCLLEAIELLGARSVAPLQTQAQRRGEPFIVPVHGQMVLGLVLRYVLHGYSAGEGAGFRISGRDGGERTIEASIARTPAGIVAPVLYLQPPVVAQPSMFLRTKASDGLEVSFPIFGEDFLPATPPPWSVGPSSSMSYVGTGPVGAAEAVRAWSAVVLKPEQALVLEAMRIVEPRIEDAAIALLPSQNQTLSVKLEGVDGGVPLGSLGEGTGRILSLAGSLVEARSGILLVDEIDRGLHVSTMEKMWKLAIETARKLDVQLFATTHSDDCLRGLAKYLRSAQEAGEGVVLLRLDRGRTEPTLYRPEEIVLGAESTIEVR